MNLEEIRKDVDILKQIDKTHEYNIIRDRISLRNIIELTETVLAVGEVLPKKKYCGKGYESCNVCPYQEDCNIYKHNKLIDDCTLYFAKKMVGLPEIIKESSLCHLCLSNVSEGEKEMNELYNEIHQHFLGKEGK